MAEYIEREALRASVESIDWYSVFRGKLTTGAESSENALYKANDIYLAIDNAPTADVAPVRHGEWIVCGDGNNVPWMCSHCGKTITRKFKMMYGKYCPNCGACMGKGESKCDT